MNLPKELEELIKELVAYEEMLKEEENEEDLEYLYIEDYSEYPEETDYDINDKYKIIPNKIEV